MYVHSTYNGIFFTGQINVFLAITFFRGQGVPFLCVQVCGDGGSSGENSTGGPSFGHFSPFFLITSKVDKEWVIKKFQNFLRMHIYLYVSELCCWFSFSRIYWFIYSYLLYNVHVHIYDDFNIWISANLLKEVSILVGTLLYQATKGNR